MSIKFLKFFYGINSRAESQSSVRPATQIWQCASAYLRFQPGDLPLCLPDNKLPGYFQMSWWDKDQLYHRSIPHIKKSACSGSEESNIFLEKSHRSVSFDKISLYCIFLSAGQKKWVGKKPGFFLQLLSLPVRKTTVDCFVQNLRAGSIYLLTFWLKDI